jgi:hypothetical protein
LLKGERADLIHHISLNNFRKFSNFALSLRKGNILVGPNNAGKSSILDALRILDACLRHIRTRNPSMLDIRGEGVFPGYELPHSAIPFGLVNVTHNYGDADAILNFRHGNQNRMTVRLHPERQTKFYINAQVGYLNTSSKFRNAFPINLVIVPTLAPLEADEKYVEDITVQRNSTTRLSSRVLRNIWLRKSNEEFNQFRADVEEAWPAIRLFKPTMQRSNPPLVHMPYSEDEITREVQWAGFGFQVWLQIHTHLRRAGADSTLIIDEPDIYLHPDLQRRLLRVIRNRFSQYIMATLSVEIIKGAETEDIVGIIRLTYHGQ